MIYFFLSSSGRFHILIFFLVFFDGDSRFIRCLQQLVLLLESADFSWRAISSSTLKWGRYFWWFSVLFFCRSDIDRCIFFDVRKPQLLFDSVTALDFPPFSIAVFGWICEDGNRLEDICYTIVIIRSYGLYSTILTCLRGGKKRRKRRSLTNGKNSIGIKSINDGCEWKLNPILALALYPVHIGLYE